MEALMEYIDAHGPAVTAQQERVRETPPHYGPMDSPLAPVAAKLRALAKCLDNESFTQDYRLEELASSAKALFDGLPGIRDAVERFKISRADD
jgi:hypothetical protein